MGWNTLMAPSIELSKLQNCFRLWLSKSAKQKANISFSTSFADICLQITWVLIGQGSLGLIGYNLYRKLQNSLVQSYVMKTDSNFGNRKKVGCKLCCKNEDIFWEMKFHSSEEEKAFSVFIVVLYCKSEECSTNVPLEEYQKVFRTNQFTNWKYLFLHFVFWIWGCFYESSIFCCLMTNQT